jgi:hypothetical protein
MMRLIIFFLEGKKVNETYRKSITLEIYGDFYRKSWSSILIIWFPKKHVNLLFIILHLKENIEYDYCLPPMVNNRVEMSVYSFVISRHLLLQYKCMCHILTLVILFIVTTTINVVFFALSSCRRTELNCGNKENERRRDDFVHPFFFLFLLRSMNRTRETKRKRERERKKMSTKSQTRAVWIKKKDWWLLLLLEKVTSRSIVFLHSTGGSSDDHHH